MITGGAATASDPLGAAGSMVVGTTGVVGAGAATVVVGTVGGTSGSQPSGGVEPVTGPGTDPAVVGTPAAGASPDPGSVVVGTVVVVVVVVVVLVEVLDDAVVGLGPHGASGDPSPAVLAGAPLERLEASSVGAESTRSDVGAA